MKYTVSGQVTITVTATIEAGSIGEAINAAAQLPLPIVHQSLSDSDTWQVGEDLDGEVRNIQVDNQGA